MLKNYIKLTWKMMMRRKAFTAITLIVIALYLMMVSTFATFSDLAMNNYAPDIHKLKTLQIRGIDIMEEGDRYYSNGFSMYALEKYMSKLEKPELIAWHASQEVYAKKDHHRFMSELVSPNFWDLLEFEFIEGRPFAEEEVEAKSQVCVITELVSKHFFGDENAFGKTLELVNGNFKVIGVIKDIHSFSQFNTHFIFPYTLNDMFFSRSTEFALAGDFRVLIKAEKVTDFEAIEAEYEALLPRLKAEYLPDPKKSYHSEVQTPIEYASIIGDIPFDVLAILSLLFLALPASSLLNINVSRIMERYSEIGIRKAFGASSGKLVKQFLVENIMFSLIGGLLGFILTWVVIKGFVHFLSLQSQLDAPRFPEGAWGFNWRVLLAMIVFSMLYGIATGVYPAWRMSRVHPIKALKA